MRRLYKCARIEHSRESARTDIDRTPRDFAESMGYGQWRYSTPEAFLQRFNADWIMDLHLVLKELLVKDRLTLGVGSGECEHEIRLSLEGYRIIGSDLLPDAFAHTMEVFPEFPVQVFDTFNPCTSERYDDILVSGLDYALDEEQMRTMATNIRQLLKPGGRLILVLRAHDNLVTRLIDYFGTPLYCLVKNLMGRLRRTSYSYRRKFQGYRRRRSEIVAWAQQAGFRVGRVRYAGFGVELIRLDVNRLFPPLYRLIRAADRQWHWFNNATIFELLT